MAITIINNTFRAVDSEMTVDEFKEWMKRFDTNRDGRISREELRGAIRCLGGRFSGWRGNRLIRQVDSDGDGYIGDDEIDNLVSYAKKNLGLKIVAY